MRYIPIGDANDLAPHGVAVSSDGRYAYVPFYTGNYVQKIDLLSDTVVYSLNLQTASGAGNDGGEWSIVKLSPLDTAFIVSGYLSNCLIGVNTATMQIIPRLSIDAPSGGTSLFPSPHGIESNITFDTFYATLGTNIAKYSFANHMLYQKIIAASGQPHQIQMTPDHSRYFVTCPDVNSPTTNSVMVYDARNHDALIKTITVGFTPQEIAISPSKGYIFVACMEDANNPLPGAHGSVYVIDYNTLDTVKIIYGDFYQPHDMAVDEQDGLLFIPSRNANPNGPAPHHTIGGKRPGWYSVYDLNTLLPVDSKRYYLPVDPYSIATRFK